MELCVAHQGAKGPRRTSTWVSHFRLFFFEMSWGKETEDRVHPAREDGRGSAAEGMICALPVSPDANLVVFVVYILDLQYRTAVGCALSACCCCATFVL